MIIAFKITNIDENLSSILEKMGYETVSLTNKGLDGVMDKPGFSKIYIQAKRYKDGSNIGRQEIQQFIGAISNKNTKKGVFITTAKFTKEAQTFAKDSQNFSVVLIDGDRLAELMIKYKVGVQTSQIYEIYKIDTDFFEENNF